jgi:energy-coupling factor transporter ATP-binding protein EcfA2
MQITNILIWQTDNTLRNFELKENKVNVITGDSGKGKSSVVAIIDYCLLSSDAEGISRTNVDNHVEWYGIRFKINSNYYVICRKALHNKDENFVFMDQKGIIPEYPENNIKIDKLKNQLNYEFGINSSLEIPYGGSTIRQGSKVSYRYFLPNSLVDQSTLIDSNYLYSKPSKIKTQERIERTFDMALGCEDGASMIIRNKIIELEKKLTQLEKKQISNKDSYSNYEEEINNLYDLGCQYKLLLSDESMSTIKKHEKLQEISNIRKIEDIPIYNEKMQLEEKIFELRKQQKEYDDFINHHKIYKDFLKKKQDELKIAKYIDENHKDIIYTPHIYEIINNIMTQHQKIKDTIKEESSSALISLTLQRKSEIDSQIEVLASQLDKLSAADKVCPTDIYRFLGKVETHLDKIVSEPKIDYSKNIEEIKKSLTELENQLIDNKEIKKFTLNLLNQKLKDIFSRMPLKGFENASPYFNKASKAIDLINNNQLEKMIDIGSASNYMYLHVAYFLSLHAIARERNVKWMPRFLVLDQPSTPYFSKNGEKSSDIASLECVLLELNNFIDKMQDYGGFQILILEHISEKDWVESNLNNFTLVDKELRGDYGLIYFPKQSE